MKVFYILHLPPPLHGSAKMGEYIKSSKLINENIEGRYLNLSTSSSIDDIGRGGLKKAFRYLNLLYQVFYQVLFWKPDLCYLTPSSYVLGMAKDSLIVAIIRIFRVRHVFHFHNKGVAFYSEKATYRSVYSFVFKKADVILLSPLLYPDIAAYVPESRVIYCANGIPKMGNRPLQLSGENESRDLPISILFLSNLMESKGIDDLLLSCRELKKMDISFRCNIAGGKGDMTAVVLKNRILQLELEEEVIYQGKVFGESKIKLFQKADIFVHPTYNDCFPLVILEAMQLGLPVISTYEGAIPEIVKHGETGLLINQRDVKGLTSALLTMINSSVIRREMGKAGKKKFDKEYTQEKFESNFLEALKSVLG